MGPSKVTMAVEGLVKMTEGRLLWARIQAADTLRKIARPGDRAVVCAMYNLCQSEDEYCRLHAAHCLGDIAIRGDNHAVSALIFVSRDGRCLNSVSAAETAQCAGIEALGKVALPGDEG